MVHPLAHRLALVEVGEDDVAHHVPLLTDPVAAVLALGEARCVPAQLDMHGVPARCEVQADPRRSGVADQDQALVVVLEGVDRGHLGLVSHGSLNDH